MRDRIERDIEGALGEIVNAPAAPDAALVDRIRSKAPDRARARRRAAVLLGAAMALMLNAALAFGLMLRAAGAAGSGWVLAVVVLAGLMLVMLPAVPLLAAGDLAGASSKKNR
jgi:hypothetical protein